MCRSKTESVGETSTQLERKRLMTDYRIEAATKEEWAERALRAEANLADGSFYQEKDIDAWQNRIEELEKACAEWAEVSQSNYERAKSAEAKLARAVEALEIVSNYRKKCHDYDDDIGHDLRTFEEEDIERIEALARTTLAELKGQNDE